MGCNNSKDSESSVISPYSTTGGQSAAKTNFKIVFLGKSGVGKTSVTLRFCRDTFQTGTEATIGASFLTKMMTINNKSIKFELWDTAGQERYRALAPMYYRNADAAVLVYDITDIDSFDSLRSWYAELQKNVPQCIIMLCGNKLDMESSRKVAKEQAEAYAHETDCSMIEVSSKTGDNISDLFNRLGAQLTEKK